MDDLSPIIKKHMPWSYSKLETARRCPFSFNKRYVDGVKAPYVENEAAKIGRLVHEILESALSGSSVDNAYKKVCIAKNTLTKLEMEKVASFRYGIIHFVNRLQRFEKGGEEQPDTSRYSTEQLRTMGFVFDEATGNFLPKVSMPKGPVKRMVEKEIAITADFKPVTYWSKDPLPLFRGKVDLAMLTTGGDLGIFDHKTSDTPTKEYSTKQMMTYEVLTFFGLSEKIEQIRTHLHFVSANEVLPFTTISAEEIREVRKSEFIQFMEACVLDLELNTAVEGKHCDWCTYQNLCPAKAVK